MITFLITSIFLFIVSVFFGIKYFLLRNGIKKYENIGTGHVGFYKMLNSSVIIYIKEIDRYTNGYSKIKLDYIDTESSYYKKIAKENFKSLIKTVNIEWLESEDCLKNTRKEKLSKLKKI
jgi:hypothetical protein